MEWISFFDRQPHDGQQVFYYGEPIGVWRGTYKRDRNDSFCEHLLFCGEGTIRGVVDRMDAPWWMPDEGQEKPQPPQKAYPDGYPA